MMPNNRGMCSDVWVLVCWRVVGGGVRMSTVMSCVLGSRYICVCGCLCMCAHVCARMCARTCMCMHVCACVGCMCVYMCACVCVWVHICVSAYVVHMSARALGLSSSISETVL